jgi:sphingosine kinase
VLVNRPCPVRLALAVAQDDKAQMVAALGGAPEALPKRDECSPVSPVSMWSACDDELDADEDAALPPLRFAAGDAAGPGWITVDRPLSYVYAGQGPYVSR